MDDYKIDIFNIKTPKIQIKKILENKNYKSTLEDLGKICINLYNIEPDHLYIKEIYNNYLNIKKFFEDYKYRISFIGGISTGKSSIVNSLIGYD